MTRPAAYNLELYRGDTYAWQFQLWTDNTHTVPADLTDVEAAAEIRNQPGGLTIMTLDAAIILPNIVQVTLAADLWAGWTHRTAAWDLQLTYPGGSIVTILAGPVRVTADVTDSTPMLLTARGARS